MEKQYLIFKPNKEENNCMYYKKMPIEQKMGIYSHPDGWLKEMTIEEIMQTEEGKRLLAKYWDEGYNAGYKEGISTAKYWIG
jgi:hypothetical protein